MIYFMAGEGRRLHGQTTPSEMPNKFQMCVREPLGVCGLITPWNFPMAIPSWKILPALILGNTVVIKPAEDTPLSTFNLVQLPRSMPGCRPAWSTSSPATGPRRASRWSGIRDVKVLSFTGSTATGQHDHQSGRRDDEARVAGDGRQERDHRDGRRRPRSGGRRRAVGRVRHQRPALHGVVAADRPPCSRRASWPSGWRRGPRRSVVGNGLDEPVSRWGRRSTPSNTRWCSTMSRSASSEGARWCSAATA